MKLFFDNNLAPRIARAVNELLTHGDSATHLRDKFGASTPDSEWISELRREAEDWVIISLDRKFAKNPQERVIWQKARLTTFLLQKSWAQQKFWTQAWRMVQWTPDIIDQAKRVEPGAAFLVPLQHSGRFKQAR